MKPLLIRCKKCKTPINYKDINPDFDCSNFESYLPDSTLSITYWCSKCEHEGQIYYGAIQIS